MDEEEEGRKRRNEKKVMDRAIVRVRRGEEEVIESEKRGKKRVARRRRETERTKEAARIIGQRGEVAPFLGVCGGCGPAVHGFVILPTRPDHSSSDSLRVHTHPFLP